MPSLVLSLARSALQVNKHKTNLLCQIDHRATPFGVGAALVTLSPCHSPSLSGFREPGIPTAALSVCFSERGRMAFFRVGKLELKL